MICVDGYVNKERFRGKLRWYIYTFTEPPNNVALFPTVYNRRYIVDNPLLKIIFAGDGVLAAH